MTAESAWGDTETARRAAYGQGSDADGDLLRGLANGDRTAAETLFARHWRAAHRAAYLIVHDAAAAEDIAQETLLAAIRNVDSFDPARPLGPWLHRIAVNRSLDWARSRDRRREAPAPEVDEADVGPAQHEVSGELFDALAVLDADQRAAIVLRHLLGYEPGEIAEMLDLPASTVRSRLARGLTTLRQRLEDTDG